MQRSRESSDKVVVFYLSSYIEQKYKENTKEFRFKVLAKSIEGILDHRIDSLSPKLKVMLSLIRKAKSEDSYIDLPSSLVFYYSFKGEGTGIKDLVASWYQSNCSVMIEYKSIFGFKMVEEGSGVRGIALDEGEFLDLLTNCAGAVTAIRGENEEKRKKYRVERIELDRPRLVFVVDDNKKR